MAKDMRRASEKKLTQIAAAPLEARVEGLQCTSRVPGMTRMVYLYCNKAMSVLLVLICPTFA